MGVSIALAVRIRECSSVRSFPQTAWTNYLRWRREYFENSPRRQRASELARLRYTALILENWFFRRPAPRLRSLLRKTPRCLSRAGLPQRLKLVKNTGTGSVRLCRLIVKRSLDCLGGRE